MKCQLSFEITPNRSDLSSGVGFFDCHNHACSVEAAAKTIRGTALSMGLEVVA